MEQRDPMEGWNGRFTKEAPADVLVVGAGHAGCEAAFASSRMGCNTLLITSQKDTLGLMPCNPAIGGLAKSHLVVELDALGGEMGLNADLTGLQYRTLNASRGPAVRAVRIQCDKAAYSARMAKVAASIPNLTLIENTVADLLLAPENCPGDAKGKLPYPSTPPKGRPIGVLLVDGCRLYARYIVITAGTALGGKIWVGHDGRDGGGDARLAVPLPETLRQIAPNLGWRRLKTGTPPRIWNASVDWANMTWQEGETNPVPFFSRRMRRFQENCCADVPRGTSDKETNKPPFSPSDDLDVPRGTPNDKKDRLSSDLPNETNVPRGTLKVEVTGQLASPTPSLFNGVPRGTSVAKNRDQIVPPTPPSLDCASHGTSEAEGKRQLTPPTPSLPGSVPRGTFGEKNESKPFINDALPETFGDKKAPNKEKSPITFGPDGVPTSAQEWILFDGFATYRLQAIKETSASGASLREKETSSVPSSFDEKKITACKCSDEPLEDEMSDALSRARWAQMPCFQTHTTMESHAIIRESLHESALYGGEIVGEGVRYCPSIEDKIVRFGDRGGHHVILEPEGASCPWCYPNGLSNSLPETIQLKLARSVPGLSHAEFAAPGYAIEYDCIDPRALDARLAVKGVPNLFMAGQINGTTGYEEAAAQGFYAGVNAALAAQGREPFLLSRDEAYIGVMVDDLITKGTDEPYRMFTSRAERRLLLRPGNAHLRLHEHAKRIGIVSETLLRLTEAEAAWLERTESAWRRDWLNGRGLSRWKLLARDCVDYSTALSTPKEGSCTLVPADTPKGKADTLPCKLEAKPNSTLSVDLPFQPGALPVESQTEPNGNRKPLNALPCAESKTSQETAWWGRGVFENGVGDMENGATVVENGGGGEPFPLVSRLSAVTVVGNGDGGKENGTPPTCRPTCGRVGTKGIGEGGGNRVETKITGVGSNLSGVFRRCEGRVEIKIAGVGSVGDDSLKEKIPRAWAEELELRAKYEGYIAHEAAQAARLAREGAEMIPSDFCYAKVKGLRFEAREKLERVRPDTLRRASGIPGVNPADVALLALALRRRKG